MRMALKLPPRNYIMCIPHMRRTQLYKNIVEPHGNDVEIVKTAKATSMHQHSDPEHQASDNHPYR